MSEQLSDRAGLPGLVARLKEFVPAKFRRGAAVVPVVRLSGVIGAVTPLRPGMTAMAKLRPAVDAFFDKVKVNDDEPSVRENRLKLLNEIRAATRAVADFSKIEG